MLKEFARFVEVIRSDERGFSLFDKHHWESFAVEKYGFGVEIGDAERAICDKYGEEGRLVKNIHEHLEDAIRKYALSFLKYVEEDEQDKRKKRDHSSAVE